MAATNGSSAGRSPARTLTALANIPTPTTPSEVAYLCASIHAVTEQLALITDIHADQLRRSLSNPAGNLTDRMKARAMARVATAPMRQSAERSRGAGSAALACWARFLRTYAALMNPPKARKGFQFQEQRKSG